MPLNLFITGRRLSGDLAGGLAGGGLAGTAGWRYCLLSSGHSFGGRSSRAIAFIKRAIIPVNRSIKEVRRVGYIIVNQQYHRCDVTDVDRYSQMTGSAALSACQHWQSLTVMAAVCQVVTNCFIKAPLADFLNAAV